MGSWLKLFYLPLLSVFLVNTVWANNANCLVGAGGKGQTTQCFQDEGIDISIPSLDMKSSLEEQRKIYLEALMTPDEICKSPEKFKRAIVCAMNKTRECMPPETRGYIADDVSILKAVDTICTRRNEIDFKCFKSKAKDLFNCGVDKAREKLDENMPFEEILCTAFELNAMCQKEVLPFCGCITTKIHSDMTLDLLYPPACPTINPRRVVCNRTNALAFIDTGLGSGSDVLRASFWRLLLVTSLWTVISILSSCCWELY